MLNEKYDFDIIEIDVNTSNKKDIKKLLLMLKNSKITFSKRIYYAKMMKILQKERRRQLKELSLYK